MKASLCTKIKGFFLFIVLAFMASEVFALNLSRVKTWTSNEVLTDDDLNAEFNNILNHSITNSDISAGAAILGSKLDLSIPGAIGGTTPNSGTFTALTSNGATILGDAPADTLHINANTITFEGATANDFEMTLGMPDVASDLTVTIPNISGTLASLSGTQTFDGTKTFSAQVASTLATGTSPFSITSTTVNTNLNADLLDGTNTASSVTASRIYISEASTGYMPDATVDTGALKTTTGEVTTTTTSTATLPGGAYGFYPQIKVSGSGTVGARILGSLNGGVSYSSTTYATIAYLEVVSGGVTLSMQQRYVTSSGTDNWIFLLVDKITGGIHTAWAAKDHPAYGNGGDFESFSHPFNDYRDKALPINLEIVILDKETANGLEERARQENRSILDIVNNDSKVDFSLEKPFVPIHSGRFLGGVPELVQSIPESIKVRGLLELTEEEKEVREREKADRAVKDEEKSEKKRSHLSSAKDKLKGLGLTDDELSSFIKDN